jgi:hypothetical protein
VDLASADAPHDLCEAREDYDLAVSRLAWACDCGCDRVGEQLRAIAWLRQQCKDSFAAMEALRAS